MLAPMVTMGPSGPADPPEPIVKVLANQCRTASEKGSCDFSRETAYMTVVTPWPRKRVGTRMKVMQVRTAPTAGRPRMR